MNAVKLGLTPVSFISKQAAPRTCVPTCRYLSASTKYVDEWFASVVKPDSFYKRHGEQEDHKKKRRCYFYNVDLQGRVFLEDTVPKNIATSIKNEAFLDHLMKQMRRSEPKHYAFLQGDDIEVVRKDYPFVSPCGPTELNFVRPCDATPVVFHAITNIPCRCLVFGGTLKQPFEPIHLAVSPDTGRLYHRLTRSGGSSARVALHKSVHEEYGLIRSAVAVTLSDHIRVIDDGTWLYAEHGSEHEVSLLPPSSDLGPWSMPIREDMEE